MATNFTEVLPVRLPEGTRQKLAKSQRDVTNRYVRWPERPSWPKSRRPKGTIPLSKGAQIVLGTNHEPKPGAVLMRRDIAARLERLEAAIAARHAGEDQEKDPIHVCRAIAFMLALYERGDDSVEQQLINIGRIFTGDGEAWLVEMVRRMRADHEWRIATTTERMRLVQQGLHSAVSTCRSRPSSRNLPSNIRPAAIRPAISPRCTSFD
jgi:hypothetical protein